jgi:DNA repair protein RadC
MASPDLRERTLRDGPASLGDADLLAVLLGTGTPQMPVPVLASHVLHAAGGLEGLVRNGVPPADAMAEGTGFGLAKRARLEAALELGRRAAVRASALALSSLVTPESVAAWARAELGGLVHEEVWLLCLDSRHALLAARRVGQGGLSDAPVAARDVLRIALRVAAAGMVLVHNHPAGDAEPSVDDARVTLSIARAGSVVGVPLVDHVIVGRRDHRSMFELGLLDAAR